MQSIGTFVNFLNLISIIFYFRRRGSTPSSSSSLAWTLSSPSFFVITASSCLPVEFDLDIHWAPVVCRLAHRGALIQAHCRIILQPFNLRVLRVSLLLSLRWTFQIRTILLLIFTILRIHDFTLILRFILLLSRKVLGTIWKILEQWLVFFLLLVVGIDHVVLSLHSFVVTVILLDLENHVLFFWLRIQVLLLSWELLLLPFWLYPILWKFWCNAVLLEILSH